MRDDAGGEFGKLFCAGDRRHGYNPYVHDSLLHVVFAWRDDAMCV